MMYMHTQKGFYPMRYGRLAGAGVQQEDDDVNPRKGILRNRHTGDIQKKQSNRRYIRRVN